MKISDDDLRVTHIAEQIIGHQFTACVITVRIIRLQDAQAVFDGEARRHDEKPAGEFLAIGAPHGVDCLPRDQHGHDRGFARSCGQFQRQSR